MFSIVTEPIITEPYTSLALALPPQVRTAGWGVYQSGVAPDQWVVVASVGEGKEPVFFFEDKEGFPTDTLVAQLMLVLG